MSRRLWFPVWVLAGAAVLAAPVTSSWIDDLSPIASSDWNRQRAAHLLERAGFGGTPEDIDKLAAMTPQQAVDSLVDYERVDCAWVRSPRIHVVEASRACPALETVEWRMLITANPCPLRRTCAR